MNSRLAALIVAVGVSLSGCGGSLSANLQEPGSAAASVAADVQDLELDADTQDFAIASAEGEEEGQEGGAEAGHQAGYDDAEQGEERETNSDPTPDLEHDSYDPSVLDESYGDNYRDAFEEAWVAAYEAAYQEGYDEGLAYYRDPEVENPYDEDCDDFGGSVDVSEDDPDNLDQDGDGVGCGG